MARPVGPDKRTMLRRRITVAGEEIGQYVFTCQECGTRWTPEQSSGRLPKLYWQCPQGCNANEKERERETAPTELDNLPAILTPFEAAALLRVSEPTIIIWCKNGDVPGAFRLSKDWRIERDALLAYIRGK